jgi:hypothetical protein
MPAFFAYVLSFLCVHASRSTQSSHDTTHSALRFGGVNVGQK